MLRRSFSPRPSSGLAIVPIRILLSLLCKFQKLGLNVLFYDNIQVFQRSIILQIVNPHQIVQKLVKHQVLIFIMHIYLTINRLKNSLALCWLTLIKIPLLFLDFLFEIIFNKLIILISF